MAVAQRCVGTSEATQILPLGCQLNRRGPTIHRAGDETGARSMFPVSAGAFMPIFSS